MYVIFSEDQPRPMYCSSTRLKNMEQITNIILQWHYVDTLHAISLADSPAQPANQLSVWDNVQHRCTVWVKKNLPAAVFWHFFPKRLGIFDQFLHTYYTFISTL